MIEIHAVTIDCADPHGLARWWSQATGWPVEDSGFGDGAALLSPPADARHQPPLLFLQVPEGKSTKNRLHLDVSPSAGRTRDEEVERLLNLGAKPYEDHRRPDGSGWMILLDPEGNEFCVCRNEAERAATSSTHPA